MVQAIMVIMVIIVIKWDIWPVFNFGNVRLWWARKDKIKMGYKGKIKILGLLWKEFLKILDNFKVVKSWIWSSNKLRNNKKHMKIIKIQVINRAMIK